MKLLCVLDQEQKWCTVSNPGMDYTHVVEQCDAACEKGGETDFVFVFCFVALRFVCLVFFTKIGENKQQEIKKTIRISSST